MQFYAIIIYAILCKDYLCLHEIKLFIAANDFCKLIKIYYPFQARQNKYKVLLNR